MYGRSTPADGGYHISLLLAGAYGRGLAVDGTGDLYVTVGNTQVLQETLSDGRYTQSTVATAGCLSLQASPWITAGTSTSATSKATGC